MNTMARSVSPRRRLVRRRATQMVWVLFICLGLLGLGVGHHSASAQSPDVLRVRIEDTISPVKARVVNRSINRAHESGAQLLVIELDTPGGLYSSTREIVEMLLESPVPVAVFVSPRGAQAGSAGTFITAAAHIAAMTPGSNIGAATPVSSSPARTSGKPWPTRSPTTRRRSSAPSPRSAGATPMPWSKPSAPPPPTAPAKLWNST